jgi:hypothetical protein
MQGSGEHAALELSGDASSERHVVPVVVGLGRKGLLRAWRDLTRSPSDRGPSGAYSPFRRQ